MQNTQYIVDKVLRAFYMCSKPWRMNQDRPAQQKLWDQWRCKRTDQKGKTMTILEIEYRPTGALRPYPRNARTHSRKQIKQIADSIRQFGFTNPLLIDKSDMILAGHGRLAAAELLAMATVPSAEVVKLRN